MTPAIPLSEVVGRLEQDFPSVPSPLEAFASLVPQIAAVQSVPLRDFVLDSFWERGGGLMVRNGNLVAGVCTTVFLTPELVSFLRTRDARRWLVFTHHPLDMESTGRGFLAPAVEWFQALQDLEVSIISCHVPLDIHPEISTSRALARRLGVVAEDTFWGYADGQIGVVGPSPVADVDGLCRHVRRELAVDWLQLHRHGGAARRLAVVAGAADHPEVLEQACDLGCDTFIAGEWYPRFIGISPNDRAWAKEQRRMLKTLAATLPMTLVGASHYSTEAAVMVADMPAYFAQLGLPTIFCPQNDPWR